MDTSNQKQKLILVDCDGVLCNWEYAFQVWMEQQGHIFRNHANKMYKLVDQYGIDQDNVLKLVKQFNESAAIGFLPSLRDAVQYVTKLHDEHGYKFHVISSLSTDINAQKLRKMNLHKLFGPTVFSEITCLATGADKHEALDKYKDSGLYWIEDKSENAQAGADLGLNSLLVEHGHNMYFQYPGVTTLKDWKHIYEHITSQSV